MTITFQYRTRSKIACSTSSGVRAPVTSSSSAARLVHVGGDEFLRRPAPRPPPRAPQRARARAPADRRDATFVTAGVSRRRSRPASAVDDRRRAARRALRPSAPTPAGSPTRRHRAGVPRRRQVALVRDDDPRRRARSTASSSRSSVAQRPRPIEHDDREVGDAARRVRPRDAFRFDGVRGRAAQARRVDERDRRRPSMSTTSVSEIARRPGNVRDDRAAGAGEPVEQARFPGVRPADDRHLRALADQPARAARPPSSASIARDDRARSPPPRRPASTK